MIVSYFESCRETLGKPIALADLAERIREPGAEIAGAVGKIRAFVASGAKDKANEIKKTLPCVTLSGSFYERKSDGLEEHSGLLTIDIDGLSPEEMEEAARKVVNDPHVALAFVSPSGAGIKGAVRVPVDERGERHFAAWLACERYFEEVHGLTLDPSGKDVNRLCFLSHDDSAAYNPDAVPLDLERWKPLTKEELEEKRILDLLEANVFRGLGSPPKPAPRVLLNEADDLIGEAGNIVSIEGLQKSGKTGVVSAILSAAIGGGERGADNLGFVMPTLEGTVLHFDCEQGPMNHYRLMQTVCRRAGVDDVPDGLLRSVSMLTVDLGDRWSLVEHAAKLESLQRPIRMVVFDGGADFLASLNDEQLAFEMVDRQHKFAIRYNCLVVVVIHENPGSESGKTRGHYGSQIHRKAQGCIVVEKGADEISSVWGKHLRDGSWPKEKASFFKYDGMKQMHVSCGDPTGERKAKKAQIKDASLRALAEKIFLTVVSLRHTDLSKAIEEREGVKERTAKERVGEMVAAGLIRKNDEGLYEKVQ